MSKSLGPAMKEQNPKPIQEMVLTEVAAGMDYLDLNIGPARRDGDKLMEWIVSVVQEVTDKPLSLDTTNPVAMEAGLKVCKSKALLNSISLQPARLESELPLVKKYNTSMIGLLWGAEGMPRDANERCAMAVEIVYKANEMGIPNEDIWIDPIVSPVSVEINQVMACIEFMSMLAEIAPGCKSVVGLSNISNGAPGHLRPYLNRAYLVMLMKYGLHSAIVDAYDDELINVARGGMPNITKLVWGMMDGEQPLFASLTPKELEYAKTVKVLTGQSLYSHSWLQI